jgi:hypothetical protein
VGESKRPYLRVSDPKQPLAYRMKMNAMRSESFQIITVIVVDEGPCVRQPRRRLNGSRGIPFGVEVRMNGEQSV